MMIEKVKKYIQIQCGLDKNKQHLVALSGGADSVCLLLVMKQLGYSVHAVHCNFNLRGEESRRDEDFCVALCEREGVELHRTHFDTRTYASLHKVSIEMAARELRYSYFENLRLALDAEDILVAHHRDDNVETVLMNIIRGTGIHGLTGIKPRNGQIVRPLLCVSRQEISDYLALQHQEFVVDSSNLVADVVRNKIRLEVLPLLESINPSVMKSIQQMTEDVSVATDVFDDAVADARRLCMSEEGRIDIAKVKVSRLGEQVLYDILTGYGFSSSLVRQIFANLDAQSGRVWHSLGYTAVVDRGFLLVRESEKEVPSPLVMPVCGHYIYNVCARVDVAIAECTEDFRPSCDPWCVTLDASKVTFPLTVRRVVDGDRFRPFGMKGSKLISDYLTDRKKDYFARREQLVVTDATGEVIWLVGERASQSAACSPKTRSILTLKYDKQS